MPGCCVSDGVMVSTFGHKPRLFVCCMEDWIYVGKRGLNPGLLDVINQIIMWKC